MQIVQGLKNLLYLICTAKWRQLRWSDPGQLPGGPSDKWKTISAIFIAFSIWYGYLCPPRKILGGVYESSKEPVFHKGPIKEGGPL